MKAWRGDADPPGSGHDDAGRGRTRRTQPARIDLDPEAPATSIRIGTRRRGSRR